mmetsp:Transcript_84336/g.103346  ORF Transcript_84336/g.103346 Transcript_84336/m.103346 type:complete len:213 (-) Transcript_84336:74-712(-)
MFMLALVCIFAPARLCEELANLSRLLWDRSLSSVKAVLKSAIVTKLTPSSFGIKLATFFSAKLVKLVQLVKLVKLRRCKLYILPLDVFILAAITPLAPARFGEKIASFTWNSIGGCSNMPIFAVIAIFTPARFCKELAHFTRFLSSWDSSHRSNRRVWPMHMLKSALLSKFTPARFREKLAHFSGSTFIGTGFVWLRKPSQLAPKRPKYHQS